MRISLICQNDAMRPRGTELRAGRGSGRRIESPRAVVTCWGTLIGLLVLISSGCTALHRRSPAETNVVAARELCRLGLNSVESQSWADAQACFLRALELCPDNAAARQHFADTLWHNGDHEKAIEELRQVVQATGGEPGATVRLGQMLLARRDYDDALECAELALRTDGQFADALVLRGDVMRARERWQEALDDYHLARSYGPTEPRVLVAMAEIQLRRDRPQRALSTLHRLRAEASDVGSEVQPLLLEGIALTSLQRYDDALARLESARVREPGNQEVLLQLGETMLAAGRNDEAAQLAAELQRQPTTDARVQRLVARTRQPAAEVAQVPETTWR
ncbi:MAG: tetratricopeptide repeat protein [Planctomycetales bacterium]|nr:tetratricopeptide repeat protein [Planctomycetales bacterium]